MKAEAEKYLQENYGTKMVHDGWIPIHKVAEIMEQYAKEKAVEFANNTTGLLLDNYTVPEINDLYDQFNESN